MSGEEYEIEEDGPAEVITGHFRQTIPDIELAKKLARYRELATEIEVLEEAKDRIRKELLELGKGCESLMAGDYAAFFKPVKGRVSIDWQGYCKSQIKNIPPEELAPYTKQGEDSVRLEVKKVR